MPVDILAIAAHRDDVELTCAGTLLKAVDAGYRTGDPRPHRRRNRHPRQRRPARRRGGARRRDPRRDGAAERRAAATRICTTAKRRAASSSPRSGISRPASSSSPSPSAAIPTIGSPPSWGATPASSPDWQVRRARHAAPAAQDPVRPLLSGGPGEADLRGGHQRPVRPQTATRSGAMPASSTAPRPRERSFRPVRTCIPWSRPRTPTTAR